MSDTANESPEALRTDLYLFPSSGPRLQDLIHDSQPTAPEAETSYVATALSYEPHDFEIRRDALAKAISIAPRYDGNIGNTPVEIVKTAELFRLFLTDGLEFVESADITTED